ncbi:hypothetical protein JCM14036_01150 [Desulfotomaculum defluvii]
MPTIIQIKRGPRTSIPATDNSPGQLFLSTDTMELFVTGTDLNVNKIRDVIVSPIEPTNQVEEQLWFDTLSHQLKVYDGLVWSPALDNRIGDLNNLLTNNKSSVISAINEVYQMSSGSIFFDEFLGQKVNVSFFSGAFSKRVVDAVLSGTAGSAIILTPPAGASSFRVYTFVSGVASVPQNNNPFLESCVTKMLVPIHQLASVEIASSTVICSLTAEPTAGTASLDVTFNCIVNYPDIVKEYQWDFNGDGVIDRTTTTGITSFQYRQPGTYPVTCTLLDDNGATLSTASIDISVYEAAHITLFTATPVTGAAPLSVAFNCVCQNSDSVVAFQWDFGDGSPKITTQTGNYHHIYSKPGVYQARCTVLDIYGYLKTSNPLSINVIQVCFAQNVITQVIDPCKSSKIYDVD